MTPGMMLGPVRWALSSRRGEHDCSVKLIVTVITTGTGLPFRSVGVNSHCLTASSAAGAAPLTSTTTIVM